MIDRLLSVVVALSLGILVWLYARSRDQEVLDNIPIPVEIALAPALAEQYDLEIGSPSQVPVSFRGPPSRIRELRGMLQRGEVRVAAWVVVPDDRQNESRYSDTVRIDADNIHGPAGVTSSIVEGRNRIPVTMHRLVERRLPVKLDAGADELVSQVSLEPKSVRVRGPQDILDRLRAIPTQPYLMPFDKDLARNQEIVVEGPVPLVSEIDGRPIRTSPAAMTVHLSLQPKQKLLELTDVPVRFLCPADFALRPHFVTGQADKINVKVWGPATERTPKVAAFIDLTSRKFVPGWYAEEPLRLQLPKDVQLAQDPPRSAAFQLIPAGAAPMNHQSQPGQPGDWDH